MKKIKLIFFLVSIALVSAFSVQPSKKVKPWVKEMSAAVEKLEKDFKGEFGIYIEDLSTGDSFAYKADEPWYLCSAIKIPVAIAFLKMLDEGKVKLKDKIVIQKSDYRDGAGPVNWLRPGDPVTYAYLFRQMVIYSDNAATDLIIKKVGIEAVNQITAKYSFSQDFGPITSLLDVRKKAYSHLHPDAEKLSNMSYMAIKKARKPKRRVAQFAKEIKVPPQKLKHQDYSLAFETYYSQGWNSATLRAYGELLRKLFAGEILSKKSTDYLLKTMARVQTGKKRIRKGLPRKVTWMHKTGTQHQRACDMGVFRTQQKNSNNIMILICTKHWKRLGHAEKIMMKIARSLSQTELVIGSRQTASQSKGSKHGPKRNE